MTKRPFEAKEGEIRLRGTVAGDGRRVLLLHGGPGLCVEYVDELTDELSSAYRVAAYQQRGLEPSTTAGPFDVSDDVSDVRRVLDVLGWDAAVLVGHSWGGHLALHVAVCLPGRVEGVLAVDPLGAVGDGGLSEFEAELARRTPVAVRDRAVELDAQTMAGQGTEDQALESLRLAAGVLPPVGDRPRTAAAAAVGAVLRRHARLRAACEGTAARIPGAWVQVVADAGHLPWLDVPGSVRTALERLIPALG